MYYCGSHDPIHAVLVCPPLSFGPPITITLLPGVLTAADQFLTDQ